MDAIYMTLLVTAMCIATTHAANICMLVNHTTMKSHLMAVSSVRSCSFGVRSGIIERCEICTDAHPN